MTKTRRLVVLGLVFGTALASNPARAGGAELKKALEGAKAAASSGDADALDRHLRAALAEGGKPPVKGLLELAAAFPAGKEALYWQVVGGLCGVTDKQGLDGIGDFLEANGEAPLARDLMLGLQANRSTEVLELHRRLLKPKHGPLQLLAVDRLGELEQPAAVDLLLELFKREEKSGSALERRVKMTLTGLVGEDMGDRLNWEGWWKANRETFFGKKAAGGATGTVKDHMDRARQGGLSSMSRGGKVVVIRGVIKTFDEIEKMLERLGVRHTVTTKTEFNKNLQALDGVAALVVDCSFFGSICRCPTCKPGQDPSSRLPVCTGCDKHDLTPDQLDDGAIQRIVAWVAGGGCVFTEDLGLKELVSKAWPDHLRVGPDLAEREIDYAPAPGQRDPALLRGVLSQPGGAAGGSMTSRRTSSWKVDNLSPSIIVADPAKVQVLLTSQALKVASEPGSGAVAVAFNPGAGAAPAATPGRGPRTGGGRDKGPPPARGGLVLHVLSHFGKQKNEQDEFTLQNLLVNFLLEAQDRYAERASKR